jgi:riboflavin synthase
MFSGIVTAVGEIAAIEAGGGDGGRDLRITAPWTDVAPGESIAVSGACLTVTAAGPGWFTVRAVAPTLERTRLGNLPVGARVNLERALRVGDRLGGHLVQGHVDGVAEVLAVHPGEEGDARLVDLRVPAEVAAASAPLGSITVDGVSLTVNRLGADGIIQVSLIPYTLAHTTLGALAVGDRVHVEADPVGRYVQVMLERRGSRG